MKKILILSANPKDTSPLRLGEEVRKIQEALKLAKHRDRFEIATSWAVRVEDLRRVMLENQPHIIHFSGHGAGTEGLAFEDQSGITQLVSGEAIASLLELFRGRVECVLLNACYSEVQAQAIHQHVDYVIGMKQLIGDVAAIEFATGFYDALGAGEGYDYAFRMGCSAIQLKGSQEHLIPVIKSRPSSVSVKKAPISEVRHRGSPFTVKVNIRNVHEREPPSLLPYLPNRSEQEFELGKALQLLQKQFPPHPLVCIIHGDEFQSHDKFLERLRKFSLPKLLGLDPTQTVIKEYLLKWPTGFKNLDELRERLCKNLADSVLRFRQLILTLFAIILTGIFLPILWEKFIKDDSSQPTQPSATPSVAPSATPSATPSAAPSATPPSVAQPNSDFPLLWQIPLSSFLLTLCIVFLVWRLWWLWRAHLFLQRHGTTEQVELHKITIHDFEQNLFSKIMFIHTAQSLRHRIRIPSHELDVDKTIDATLRQGGWLTPVYDTRQVLPEYLFLINRASYRDHQAKFMEEMVALLRHNGVFITSYFFDDDPRICFPSDGTSSPRKLNEITAKYTQHRLVIVSDTEKLFSTQTGELEPWVSQMTNWGNRAILTPKPVENWGYQELELARQFIVLPATPKGVRMLSQVLHQGAATYVLSEQAQIPLPETLRVRPHYWIERNPPTPEQIDTMLNSLQKYLGKDGFYWLSACAVFPELHWNITIYLGNVLKTSQGHCLLEVCSLSNLARLPWFRYGDMPDWLRSLLIATLTHEQKLTIRTAFQDLLVTAVQGSVGRLQLEVAKKHHSFLPKLANAILHLLSRRVTKGSPLRDYLFLSFMTGQPKLAVEVPDTFSRLLQKQKRWKIATVGLVVSAVSLSIIYWWLFVRPICFFTDFRTLFFSVSKSLFPMTIACTSDKSFPGITLCPKLADVPNVPSGLYNYGGSTAFAPLRSSFVQEQIMTSHPNFLLRYIDAAGSSAGIKMLLDGNLSFLLSSRPLITEERNVNLKQIPIALDGIAIYVNPQLPIPGLTLSQIKDIFTGKITNWSQLGGPNLKITIFARSNDSATSQFFRSQVLQEEPFSPNSIEHEPDTTTNFLIDVAKTPGSISFAPITQGIGQKNVRLLPIASQSSQPFVTPCGNEYCTTINKKALIEYPLTRQVFVVIRQDSGMDEQAGIAYANLLLSDEGQRLVEQAGYVPIDSESYCNK